MFRICGVQQNLVVDRTKLFYETVLSYISMKVFAVVTRNFTDALEKHKVDTVNLRGSGFDPYLGVVAAE
jgi:hypothetical protein